MWASVIMLKYCLISTLAKEGNGLRLENIIDVSLSDDIALQYNQSGFGVMCNAAPNENTSTAKPVSLLHAGIGVSLTRSTVHTLSAVRMA
jgi:hypothetical protein